MGKAQKAILVAGLGFGDEGKGSSVDYLVRKTGAHTVVRYNGGAQAAHAVVTPDGRSHVFAQFGSGTFTPGVRTHLSRFMILNPVSMLCEKEYLRGVGVYDAFNRTTIDENAIVVTPFQKSANRLREIARGESRNGSCGMGIGETVDDFSIYGAKIIQAKDLGNPAVLRKKLEFIREIKLEYFNMVRGLLPKNEVIEKELGILENEEFIELCLDSYAHFARKVRLVGEEYLPELLREDGTVIFEGAQGVLLDRKYGFQPHVTKTDATFNNAETLLREACYGGDVERVGILRGYFTRHGKGPLITEDETLAQVLADEHNFPNPWQGALRIGHFDAALARYALKVAGGVYRLMLTNLDRMLKLPEVKICTSYEIPDFLFHPYHAKPNYQSYPAIKSRKDLIRYARHLGELLKTPVGTVSFGPTAEDKLEL